MYYTWTKLCYDIVLGAAGFESLPGIEFQPVLAFSFQNLLKYGNVVEKDYLYLPLIPPFLQHYDISGRFRRVTKCVKFSRAEWGFEVNSRQ